MTMARFRAVSALTRNSQTHIPMEPRRPSGAKFLGGSRAETDHNPQATAITAPTGEDICPSFVPAWL